MEYISKLEMSYEEWLESRRKGLGGSDVGAVLGFNKYKTPLDVYLEKIEGKSTPDNDAMKAGRMLEDTVAKWYSEETGKQIVRDNKIRIHSEHEFLIANIDRRIIAENGAGPGVLEVKTASGWAFKEWQNDGLPLNYYAQIQHYFSVTGYTWGAFAVLVDGRAFDVIPVVADSEFIDAATARLIDFWNNHIMAKVPPEAKTEGDVKYLYPKSLTGKSVEIDQDRYEVLMYLKRIGHAKSKLEKKYDELASVFKMLAKDAELLLYQGEKVATYKNDKKSFKFDEEKFAAEHPDLYSQYQNEVLGSRRFLLKLN
jgi:putative phage-type endonuclease